MNVLTPTMAPGARSLPAELLIPRQYRKVDWGRQRLLQGGPNRMQSAGGVMGLQGIGDCPASEVGWDGNCPDGSVFMGGGGVNTGGVISSSGGGSGIDWGALSNIITVSSTSLAKILAASNPGTYYKDPSGVIYSQPTGSTATLPVGGGYGTSGSVQTTYGSATFGGLNLNTLLIVGVLGFALVMVAGRR